MRKVLFIVVMMAALATNAQRGVSIKRDSGMTQLDTASVDYNVRMALVIGNQEYTGSRLRNPVNDARDVASLLGRYGFEVTLLTDAHGSVMDSTIESFSRTLRQKRGIGLFYFSGHGIQYNSQNFLLPLGAEIAAEASISTETVAMQQVLSRLSYSKNGMNIVILDACRNNPYQHTLSGVPKGLTYSINKMRNTLVFFATSANDVADDGAGHNSPFTEALVETINRNDTLELMYIAKQVTRAVEAKTNDLQTPQYVGTLKNDFYFRQKDHRQPQLFILSIGVSRYEDGRYSLKYSSKGAKDFVEYFKDQAPAFYSEIHPYYLTDEYATAKMVQQYLRNIKERAKDGDMIFVYYNGHVLPDGDDLFFMPHDANFSKPAATGISRKEILAVLADLPCKTLLFMDAAAATGAGLSFATELTQPRNNVVVLSATSGTEFAFESESFMGTVFSKALVEGLAKAESREQPGNIDVESLGNYVIERVSNLTNNMQVPQLHLPKGWKNFVIAKKR